MRGRRAALASVLLLAGCDWFFPPKTGMVELEHADGRVFWIDHYEFPNDRDTLPDMGMSLATAQAACESVGKRLCTAEEWRRACRGLEGRRFPYGGGEYWPKRCHLNVHIQSGHTSMQGDQEFRALPASDKWCRTDEGVYDMVGNVEEWVLDDWNGRPGSLEGGAAYTHYLYATCLGEYARAPDFRLDPGSPISSAGARCCRSDAPPDDAAISADADARITAALQAQAPVAYDPAPEVVVAEGVSIDKHPYPNRPGVKPWTAVDHSQAAALCAVAGKRLCTTHEWEQACTGGSTAPPDPRDSLACNTGAEALAEVGSHAGCTTPGGATDMLGSVWEWTATPLRRAGVHSEGEALYEVRGGAFNTDPRRAVCRPRDGYPAAPDGALYPDLGFRCCRGTPGADDPGATSTTAASSAAASSAAASSAAACPDGMAAVGDGCIDRTELVAADGLPVTGLGREDAAFSCRALGKHLCSRQEWLAACQGATGRAFPYGDTFDADACRTDGHGDTRDQLLPPGSQPACATPEGVLDLSGNAWEWTADGAIRGGGPTLAAGLSRCTAEADPDPGFSGPTVGARCCATPEEAAVLR